MSSLSEALGKELAAQYDRLCKEKIESLKDNQAAKDYVNGVIQHWQILNTLNSDCAEIIDKKNEYMPILKSHIISFAPQVSSNSAEITNWLKMVDCSDKIISATLKNMEQPGCDEEDPCCSGATCATTSETCNGPSSQGRTHYHTNSFNGVAGNPYGFYSPGSGTATFQTYNTYNPVNGGANVHSHVSGGANVHSHVGGGANVHSHVGGGANVHEHVGGGPNIFARLG